MQMNVQGIELEFRSAPTGDLRRSERLESIGVALARDPTLSFPAAMETESGLEALYRFLNNDHVSFDAVRAPHVKRTALRARAHDSVLVLHDTTTMQFSGSREGLGTTQSRANGFFLHASLVVSNDRGPVGVLNADTWVRAPGYRRVGNKRDTRRDPSRESLRWWRAVEKCNERLGSCSLAVHVMDREGDNYDLFSKLIESGARFVIRLAHNRNLVGETEKLKEVVSRTKALFRRQVRAAPRIRKKLALKKSLPERASRDAALSVSATSVQFRRSTNYVVGNPPSLEVNVVTVVEENCPAGEEPIAWYLVTSEPVSTAKQVAAVVDAYRARWTIEEFFKALKTGCQFEKRQLESFQALRIALAIFLPIALRLLALRSAARSDPGSRCRALSKRQLSVLRTCGSKPLSKEPTNQEVCNALAALGGHLRSNGPPGWIILGRAFEKLLVLERGWRARGKRPTKM
jgi:Transposase DNA-binding/Transposase DDE domain